MPWEWTIAENGYWIVFEDEIIQKCLRDEKIIVNMASDLIRSGKTGRKSYSYSIFFVIWFINENWTRRQHFFYANDLFYCFVELNTVFAADLVALPV